MPRLIRLKSSPQVLEEPAHLSGASGPCVCTLAALLPDTNDTSVSDSTPDLPYEEDNESANTRNDDEIGPAPLNGYELPDHQGAFQ